SKNTIPGGFPSCAAPPPGATTYAYDTRGNLTTITPLAGPSVTLTYDQANRLTGYGAVVTYTYNGDGLRMAVTVSGTATDETWDTSSFTPLMRADGSTDYVYGPARLPSELIPHSGYLFYYQHQLGSTTATR